MPVVILDAFNSVRRGPRQDLVAELHDASRAAGARFGVYFSGALDWHVSGFPPIESDVCLFRHRRNDEWSSRYSAAHSCGDFAGGGGQRRGDFWSVVLEKNAVCGRPVQDADEMMENSHRSRDSDPVSGSAARNLYRDSPQPLA